MRPAALVASQREYFASGATRTLDFRIESLSRLEAALRAREQEALDALAADLGKPAFESFSSEIAFLYRELAHTRRHLRRWMKPQKVSTPLALQPGVSRVYSEPLGVVCVIAPWNYPLQLLLSPVIGAVAAGNCVIMKPSEFAPATSAFLARLIDETFPPHFLHVLQGGVEVTTEMLNERFDQLFFTGSASVGRIIMEAAAKHLTPVLLELGGKSPCLVEPDADLEVTARRIAWGKFFNAGQTCVAPDYLLVHASIRDELLAKLQHETQAMYGRDPSSSPDYARIINDRHFERLIRLLEGQRVICGGGHEARQRYLAPTLLDTPAANAAVMQEEIFGPILPVIPYASLDEAVAFIHHHANPLALYLFTKNRATEKRLLQQVSFGGGCVNDCLVHLANPNLPFGGVGHSGIGAYHGKYSFDAFSHFKGVCHRSFRFDVKFRYPPYTDKAQKFIRRLLRV